MKIGLYDPYLDTTGGGEKYMMTIAELLSTRHIVDVFWDEESTKKTLEERLNLNLGKVKFVTNIFKSETGLFKKFFFTKTYDRIIFLSDGSIPFLFSKKNILHFQVPFKGARRTFLNKLKLKKIDNIICNSIFTKQFIDDTYGVSGQVIYPPVDTEAFVPGMKQNIILSVGRFSKTLHSKKQEILIEAFKTMMKSGLKDWKLILIGNIMPEDKPFVDQLRKTSSAFPIEIITDASFTLLKKSYGEAKIYWHATGFGEDDNRPERMEHFGISTVEAMSGGCVPIVFNGGGQKEIVGEGENGFLWRTKDELVSKTLAVINNENIRKAISISAQERSKNFSKGKFCEEINEIIK